MINPAAILLVLLLAFWDAWQLLAVRLDSGVDAIPLLLVLTAVFVPLARRLYSGAAGFPVELRYLTAALLLYVSATLFAPPPIRIAVAAVTLLGAMHQVGIGRRPGAPFVSLTLLALPVLPSLEFFLAYPLRVASAGITALMLRTNGFPVALDGVALRWGEATVQFDAACSGVRMLWGALFLASALALIAGLPLRRYALLIAAAVPLAIFANALRAASLFYLEANAAALSLPPAAHELTGIAAFAMLAVAVMTLGVRQRLAQ
uniref:archaeosortase/exosortase family protein n=1 Tax=uncultured Sphingomonas sp. TaxID=158754 RepID=UPI0025D2F34C|nr:archaeosortase/exosortase family protein [uncultured Sphingomonas sp.]